MKIIDKAVALTLVILAATVIADMFTLAQARSLEEIKASGEIRFCIWASDDPNTASVNKAQPLGCRDDCMFTGFFHEWSLAFADWLGPDIRPKFWRMESWDEQFRNEQGEVIKDAEYTPALLASGTCDLYSTILNMVPWRQNKFAMVPLYVSRWMVIIHKSNQDNIKTLADLGGKVTMRWGKFHPYTLWVEEQNKTRLADRPVRFLDLESDNTTLPLELLEAGAGELDFSIEGASYALSQIRKYKNLVGAFAVGPLQPTGWGFRKQDKDLQAAAKAFFDEQRSNLDSPLNKAWEGYTGMSIPRFIELVTAIK